MRHTPVKNNSSTTALSREQNTRIPTIFVVLGVTGDLTAKKIAPALFNLFEANRLPPKFEFVGVSRRDWTDEDLRNHLRAILHVKAPNAPEHSIDSFLKLATYGKVRFDEPGDYAELSEKLRGIDDRWGVCTNKLFYLSVPPQFYDRIFENLHRSHLTDPCGSEEGWTRVVVEKPFGGDEKTAKALDAHLARLFREEQIYRIDHYLAKEMLQNIMVFRFANNLFEREWSSEAVESINIRLYESIGAEDRGSFYDGVGALRDVGQNHLLQMLALVTMERPRGYGPEAIRAARTELLEALAAPTLGEAASRSFRAQYDGYRKIAGVAPNSETETFFRITGFLEGSRWSGVPIVMEGGKRLGKPRKEIEIVLRHEASCACGGSIDHQNRITIRLEPSEGITVDFVAKKPGHSLALEERSLGFDFRDGAAAGAGHGGRAQYVEEYEKLILDCIAGDQTLFVSSREIRAMWRFTDPFMAAWRKGMVILRTYAPDSAAIAAEAAVIADAAGRAVAARKASAPREIGLYGLGKMGANLARNMRDAGWRVVAANRSSEPLDRLAAEGFETVRSLDELIAALPAPRVIWLMVTAGRPVDDLLAELLPKLRRGDTVIDGGNSFFEDTVRRGKLLAKRGVRFLDAGVSGGPGGARKGACIMVGGDRKAFEALEPLFEAISVREGYAYFGNSGAGHFVKMVHNGIEYGMMQSIAEGFALMKRSPFKLDLQKIAHLYNHGSVVESRLVGWLESGFAEYGEDLKPVSGSVAYTGEGEWTVKTGRAWKMKLPAIEDSFRFRVRSGKSPSYTGRILSALRNQFGGHSIGGSASRSKAGAFGKPVRSATSKRSRGRKGIIKK